MNSFNEEPISKLQELLNTDQVSEYEGVDHDSLRADEERDLLIDEESKFIFMHRDAHFSGNFDIMLSYYENEDNKGVQEDFSVEAIKTLQEAEKNAGENLAPYFVTGADAEKVAFSLKMYKDLRCVAEKEASLEGLLAEIILSEDSYEELVEKTPVNFVEKAESLIQLAESEIFSDPLFPGYGQAPLFAISFLGKAKFEPAIPCFFQLIGKTESFEKENVVLKSLALIGEKAKAFSFKILKSRPITYDHERALLVLLEFLPDVEVEEFLKLLKGEEDIMNSLISKYLM